MKKSLLFLPVVFMLTITTGLFATPPLQAIDSLYMQGIKEFYAFAREHKEEIWPGMTLGPLCVYRMGGPAFLYNHPEPPPSFVEIASGLYMGQQSEQQLFGSTTKPINGVLTAIADYGSTQLNHPNEFWALAFHELHHVWQLTGVPELNFDNPALLVTYPENYQNDALKIQEHNWLYQMVMAEDEAEFRSLLNRFYSSRLVRAEIIGDYLAYDTSVETCEGPAAYNEYRFYELFSQQPPHLKNHYGHAHFWKLLLQPRYGRENLRARHLASGMALCLLLDRYANDWKTDFYASGIDLYDYFVQQLQPKPVEVYPQEELLAMSRFFIHSQQQEREAYLKKFYEQAGTKIVLHFASTPGFRGFDPMNAQAINENTILHKTMLNLARGDNRFFVTGREVVATFTNQLWFVNKVIFFVPNDSIELTDNEININIEGVNIRWKGKVKERGEKMVWMECE